MPLLLVCGAPGAGKSSVAWEIYLSLVRARKPLAHLDLDPVGYGPPGWFGTFEMKMRNLAALWQSYVEVGAAALVVSGASAARPEIDACIEAIPDAAPTICHLTVSEPVPRDRLLRRARELYGLDQGGASTSMSLDALEGFLGEAAQAVHEDEDLPGALRFATDNRAVPEIARDVLARTGWPD